jgi:hypothetical protein
MNSSYITTDKEELKNLFDQIPDGVKTLIKGGDVKSESTVLGQKFNLAIGKYVMLSNIITSILIGALEPRNVIPALKEILEISQEDATKLAQDLESGILNKARNITLGKQDEPVAVLEFKGPKTQDELRKEIMDTTKRESALMKPQTSGIPKKTSVITPGSRSQLLEQLQILSAIPNDSEVEARLNHIQEQINSIKKVEENNTLDSNIALKSFMFGEEGKSTVEATLKTATYSVAPTRYNLDPYREISEE